MIDSRIATLRRTDRGLTIALVVVGALALVFTCVNVTLFAISHGTPWYIAWLLDPMVSLALGAVLLTDGILGRHGDRPGGSASGLRLFAGLATWAMNVWGSVWPDGGFGVPKHPDAAGIVLHSVPPVLLILLAEAVTVYRRRIAEIITKLEGFTGPELGGKHTREVPDAPASGVSEPRSEVRPDTAGVGVRVPAWDAPRERVLPGPDAFGDAVAYPDALKVWALLNDSKARVSYRRVQDELGLGFPKARVVLDAVRAVWDEAGQSAPGASRLSLVPAREPHVGGGS